MQTASCLCGACKLSVSKIITTAICHCMVCRKMTSSPYSLNAVLPSDALILESGNPKICILPSNTGADAKFYFCGDCGSALWAESAQIPGLKALKAGLLDGLETLDSQDLKPTAEQFVARRPAWMQEAVDAKQIEGMQEGAIEKLMELAKSKM